MVNNKKLFADMQKLGVTQFSQDDPSVTQEEFDKLQLNFLDPYYWTWRKLGRDKQTTANSFWDLVSAWISEVKLFG